MSVDRSNSALLWNLGLTQKNDWAFPKHAIDCFDGLFTKSKEKEDMKHLRDYFKSRIKLIKKHNKAMENDKIDTFPAKVEEQKEIMYQIIETLKRQEEEMGRIVSVVLQKKTEIEKENKIETMKALQIAESYKQAVNKLVTKYKAVWEEAIRNRTENKNKS